MKSIAWSLFCGAGLMFAAGGPAAEPQPGLPGAVQPRQLSSGSEEIVSRSAKREKIETGQQPRELTCTIKVTMKYLLYLPKDYEQKSSWPLLLFLHGMGERGDNLKLVEKHGPPKLIAAGRQFPFIVALPQCPKDQSWEPLSWRRSWTSWSRR